jgi:hypothetical protein
MKQTVLALGAVLVIGAAAALAQDQVQQPTDEMMAEFVEMARPGPEHERLAGYAGKWSATTLFWIAPGGDTMTIDGTQTNEMVLGGRFLMSNGKTSGGIVVGESLTLLGFDRRLGEYTMVTFDTWGTYYITARGKHDPETDVITLSGEDFDPLMNFTQEYYFRIRFVDEDTYTEELFFTDSVMTQGLGEFRMSETTYTRVTEDR